MQTSEEEKKSVLAGTSPSGDIETVKILNAAYLKMTEQVRLSIVGQEKVVEQAEEALRLARARSEAGTGTQLDVLSAQTALTEARTTQVQALRDYSVARARLERAIGMNSSAS